MSLLRNTGLAMLLLGLASGCAKAQYMGNGAKGFWSDDPARVSPNDAFREAQPHLAATWTARCKELRHDDEWCQKPPVDHMVRKGDYYYVTRTSFPYGEDYEAYTKYAVRINVETGKVIPYQ